LTKFKIGLMAFIAGLIAFTGVVGVGTQSAFAADGDVCGVFSSTGTEAQVGEHFYVLARIQDNFKINFDIDFDDTDDDSVVDTAEVSWTSSVLIDGLVVDVANQVGEALIVDRIEDDDEVWNNWWDLGPYGDAGENSISPVAHLSGLDIFTVLAYGGNDDFDTLGDVGSLDISEFFIEKATDAAAAAGALTDCGSAMVSIDASFAELTVPQAAKLLGQIVSCILDTSGDDDECEALADLLDSIDGPGHFDDNISNIDVNFQIDGWAEISVKCTKPGEVVITFDPTGSDFRTEGRSIEIECIGAAQSATATANPATVEIHPVGTNVSQSALTVIVLDANGKRLNGAAVTFTTNICNLGGSTTGPFNTKTLTVLSDTDTAGDLAFMAEHGAAGNQIHAGTAEAYLECEGTSDAPGTANVSWTVSGNQQNGVTSGTVTAQAGTLAVKVVGSPATMQLGVSPNSGSCGTPMTATATVLDGAGQTVSDGTEVFFTTTTATGVQTSSGGASGLARTVNGVASVVLSVDPMDGGSHTVSARTGGNDLNGHAVNAVSQSTTISCTATAAAAPAPPLTAPRTGVGSITPPNTGDAGLAASSGTPGTLFAVAGAVLFAIAGLATVKFARN
jgi:hypothetical protein